MIMTYLKAIHCAEGICTLNGTTFEGTLDVMELMGEHEVEGSVVQINHDLDSAIALSAKWYHQNMELRDTIRRLNEATLDLVAQDYLLITGEEL